MGPLSNRALSALTFAALSACAAEPACPEGPIFTAAVVHPDSVQLIDPLGNTNPPGHTFPSDHMGIALARDGSGQLLPVDVFSPGDLRVVRVRAVERPDAGVTDFAIDLQACGQMTLILGHIGHLDEELFAGWTDLSTWHLDEEYTTGGETYRVSSIEPGMLVGAGTRLGGSGESEYQSGLDYGFYDRSRPPTAAANPDRWGDYGYLHSFSPLEYYVEGELKDTLSALVAREPLADDPYPYGRAMQDVPGSAHGTWFLPGANFPPEDAHLALVQWNSHPSLEIFSIGNGVPSLPSGIYPFEPADDGTSKRHFADVVPGDGVYGYHVGPMMTPDGFEGTIVIRMPDADTLWIEGFDTTLDPADWVFTGAKTVFER